MTGSADAGSGRGRTVALIGSAVVGAVVIGGVLYFIDRTPDGPARELARDPQAIDLLPPPPPLDGEDDEQTGRGWIQIADETGQLAQQYRCDFLDPSPEGYDAGWIRMTRPQLEVYQDDGSVVVLSGDEAMAFAPSSAVESGTISGNVEIRVYTDAAARRADRPLKGLELELRTDKARLDGVLGEVTCPGSVLAETPEGVFVGRDVRLLLGDGEHAISSLAVREVEHVRFVSQRSAEAVDAVDAADAAGAGADARRPVAEPGAMRARAAAPAPLATPAGPRLVPVTYQATAVSEPRWYRMVMRDEVRIRRGAGAERIEASADELHAIFGESGGGTGLPEGSRPDGATSAAPAAAVRGDAGRHPASIAAASPVAMLTAAAIAAEPAHPWDIAQRPVAAGADVRTLDRAGHLVIAPAPRADDTWVTCTGGLVMRPLNDRADRPTAADGSRLELRAREDSPPITLTDHGAGTTASARRASYELPAGRIALVGRAAEPVDITGPEFSLDAPSITIVRADGVGRLDGAGHLAFSGAPDEDGTPGQRLNVAWTDGVDLSFDQPPAEDAAAGDGLPALDLGSLRDATFAGAVRLAAGDADGGLDLLPGGAMVAGAAPAPSSGLAESGPDLATPESGTMTAEEVRVAFSPDSAGDLQPTRLTGTGDVIVTGGPRRLWADSVDATFLTNASDAAAGDRDGAGAEAGADDAASAAIERVIATGDVAVRLEGDRFAWADRLELEGPTRRTILEGHDVRFEDGADRLQGARRVVIEDARDRAEVDGAGRFRRLPATAAAITAATDATDTPPGRRPVPTLVAADAIAEFDVRWSESLTIDPEPSGGRRIEVRGAVDVAAEALALRGADRVVAFLAPESDANADADTDAADNAAGVTEGVRRIEAQGTLTAIALDEDAALDCRELTLDLLPGPDGPQPSRLEAGGDVRVTSPERRLWSDALTVTFLAPDQTPAAAAPPSGPSPADGLDAGTIDTVLAEGAVEVRLADGRRVLGDRLEASGINESAVITGNLLVATEQALLVQVDTPGAAATRIEIEDAGEIARVVGPGRFLGLSEATALADPAGRSDASAIRRRVVEAPRELEAVWTDGATWTSIPTIADDGAGTLVLAGAVDAIAEPRPRERNRIRAGELTLVFAGEEASDTVPAPGAEADAADVDDDGLAMSGRRLSRMIARGNARLESRAWMREDRSDEFPRVFALDGDTIDWDQAAGVAVVDGPGRLIVRDLRQPDEPPAGADAARDEADDPMSGTGFGPRGTSQFTWTGGLRLEPTTLDEDAGTPDSFSAGGSRVTMTRGVEVLHRGLDAQTATLTSQQLVATLARVVDDVPTEDASTLALGGPVELVQLDAKGSVYVETPARNVSCETFVYDARRGMARIAAGIGRPPVSILETGASAPVTISGAAMWNMRTDRIVVEGGAGSSGRG